MPLPYPAALLSVGCRGQGFDYEEGQPAMAIRRGEVFRHGIYSTVIVLYGMLRDGNLAEV